MLQIGKQLLTEGHKLLVTYKYDLVSPYSSWLQFPRMFIFPGITLISHFLRKSGTIGGCFLNLGNVNTGFINSLAGNKYKYLFKHLEDFWQLSGYITRLEIRRWRVRFKCVGFDSKVLGSTEMTGIYRVIPSLVRLLKLQHCLSSQFEWYGTIDCMLMWVWV